MYNKMLNFSYLYMYKCDMIHLLISLDFPFKNSVKDMYFVTVNCDFFYVKKISIQVENGT